MADTQPSLTVKAEAIEIINRLSDDVTLEQIVDSLDRVVLIKEGLADIEMGLIIPHEQVVREHLEWRKSRGL